MMRYLSKAALVAAALSGLASADIPKCGPSSPCPESTPCCSMYGQCGVGAYCLGGCDPLFSNKLTSCVPNPTCQSQTYSFKNLDDVVSIDKYLGDSSKAKWVVSGKPVKYEPQGISLTMAQDTVGTLLASTQYVWYGKISAKMTASQGKGVVTAFIMMSDVKDEIDFEFVGVDLDNVQSNFYSQGVTNYNNGGNITADKNNQKLHTYTIDWQPDKLVWSVDDKPLRTLERSKTWNSTSNRFDYPQTPSRIMLSLWPAGLPSNGEGTVSWAGGLIDWNSPAMNNKGFYYAVVQEVTVECYNPPPNAQVRGNKKAAYIYTDERGTNDTVAIIDKTQVLGSFYGTGEDPKTDSNASKPTSSPDAPETIPGMVGGGNRETEGQNNGADSSNSGSGGSGSGGSGSGSGSGSSGSNSANGGFSQNAGSGAPALAHERKVGGSVFAVCVAVMALLVL